MDSPQMRRLDWRQRVEVVFEGAAVEVALMLAGVGLVATVAASIAAYFVGSQEPDALARIEARLERIERALQDPDGSA